MRKNFWALATLLGMTFIFVGPAQSIDVCAAFQGAVCTPACDTNCTYQNCTVQTLALSALDLGHIPLTITIPPNCRDTAGVQFIIREVPFSLNVHEYSWVTQNIPHPSASVGYPVCTLATVVGPPCPTTTTLPTTTITGTTTTTLPCVPVWIDTVCIGPDTMETSDQCAPPSYSSRYEPILCAAATTTTTDTTTTTSTTTTTTTVSTTTTVPTYHWTPDGNDNGIDCAAFTPNCPVAGSVCSPAGSSVECCNNGPACTMCSIGYSCY